MYIPNVHCTVCTKKEASEEENKKVLSSLKARCIKGMGGGIRDGIFELLKSSGINRLQ
jgi:hypothetical protein